MRRWTAWIVLGMVVLAAAGAGKAHMAVKSQTAAKSIDPKSELMKLEQSLWEANKSGDTTQLKVLIAADAAIYEEGERRTGDEFGGGAAPTVRSPKMTDVEATVLGAGAGIVRYSLPGEMSATGDDVPDGPQIVADTWQRKNGKWMLVFEMRTLLAPEPGVEEKRIRAVLEDQQAEWNRGDIDSFMKGYWNSPHTEFVTANGVVRGWQAVLDRYHKSYPGQAAMGTLAFSDLEVQMVSPTAALVTGAFQLQREKDTPGGTFTLLFRRFADGWKITSDHTSVKPEAK
jgi:ketosteroid isomerase-like protein